MTIAAAACHENHPMNEKSILFSGPMIRALLAGTKTQTRRIIKPQPDRPGASLQTTIRGANPATPITALPAGKSPYGLANDRLWVKESFSGPNIRETLPPRLWQPEDPIWYWADGKPPSGAWTRPRSSLFMPRWASRILLQVIDVRSERLQDCSPSDAMAEGLLRTAEGFRGAPDLPPFASPLDAYRSLWERINGVDSWAANPWVWVVRFRIAPR